MALNTPIYSILNMALFEDREDSFQMACFPGLLLCLCLSERKASFGPPSTLY